MLCMRTTLCVCVCACVCVSGRGEGVDRGVVMGMRERESDSG